MLSKACLDFGLKNNDKDSKFEVGSNVIISKYKNIFVKGYTPNLSKEAPVITKVKKYCIRGICNRRA